MISKKSINSIIPDNWIISALIFLSTVIYFIWNGTGENVWYDEGVTLFHSNKTYFELLEFSKRDNNPPLFNILLFFWSKLFGYSVWTARLLPTIIAGISSVFLYKSGRLIYGPVYAIISIVFFTVFNLTEYHAVEIRSYGLMLMFALISIYALLKLNKTNEFKYFVIWIITVPCLFFTHYASAVYLIISSPFALPFLFKKGNFKSNMKWIIPLVLTALASIIYWSRYPIRNARSMAENDFWLKAPDWGTFKYILSELSLIIGFDYRIYFALALGGLAVFIFKKTDGKRSNLNWILPLCLLLAPFLSYLISQHTPMFGTRYLIFVAPVTLVLLFMVAAAIPKNIGYLLVGGLMIYIFLNPSKDIRRSNYNELSTYVNAEIGPNTLVLLNEQRMVLPYLINENGNIYRSDAALQEAYTLKGIKPTSKNDFADEISVDYLKTYDEIMYVIAFEGASDPKRIISKRLTEDFDLIKTNNDIYAFHTEHYIRKSNVKITTLINIKLDDKIKAEGLVMNIEAFTEQPDLEFVQIKKNDRYSYNVALQIPDKYALNPLSVASFKIPMNIHEMSPGCEFILNLYDSEGAVIHYNRRMLNDYDIAYDQWKDYVLNIPIGKQKGRSIQCFFRNNNKDRLDVKPLELTLKNVTLSSD